MHKSVWQFVMMPMVSYREGKSIVIRRAPSIRILREPNYYLSTQKGGSELAAHDGGSDLGQNVRNVVMC
jgi:hypothetical protein